MEKNNYREVNSCLNCYFSRYDGTRNSSITIMPFYCTFYEKAPDLKDFINMKSFEKYLHEYVDNNIVIENFICDNYKRGL